MEVMEDSTEPGPDTLTDTVPLTGALTEPMPLTGTLTDTVPLTGILMEPVPLTSTTNSNRQNGKDNTQPGGEDQCAICLESFVEEEQGLICSHVFHSECIEPWLQQDGRCPLCRTRIRDVTPVEPETVFIPLIDLARRVHAGEIRISIRPQTEADNRIYVRFVERPTPTPTNQVDSTNDYTRQRFVPTRTSLNSTNNDIRPRTLPTWSSSNSTTSASANSTTSASSNSTNNARLASCCSCLKLCSILSITGIAIYGLITLYFSSDSDRGSEWDINSSQQMQIHRLRPIH